MNETTVFATALEKRSAEERAAYLTEACAGDPILRRRVDALLEAHLQSDAILDAAGREANTADYAPITEKVGSNVGPYRLMEQIGEGGFGVVFVAEQQQPVRRKVALKLIKPGMDSNQVIARFQAERQALAMMDHPNIARVLDAGTTDAGRPYFVMELVRGIAITEYCDKNQLNPTERMEIFVTVCNAIQHAHQKGIIHRDIKPSNVLVTSHDGKPLAKVIDFGVAKAIHQQLTDRTIYTQFTQMIGTPLYMSPEQAEMSSLDIDTRSDIYSLGVLLYELFTGSTPLEKSRLVSAAYDEVRRLIREEEPLLPSLRLSTSVTLPSLAASRKTEPARLSKLMKGELDWIVMKSLEKDRTRRYETANALAADIDRYLRDEQVEACPPSTRYRLQKFIRRNRLLFVSGSLVAAALLMGVVFSTAFALHARNQQSLARQARLAAEQERDRAEKSQQAAVAESKRADAERLLAENASKSESIERAAAEQQRDKARALSEELTREKHALSLKTEEQRRLMYISDMNAIQSAWDQDNMVRIQELLNKHRPWPGQVDLRGFEWHYWNRRCHSEIQTVSINDSLRVVGGTAINSSGTHLVSDLAGVSGLSFDREKKANIWDVDSGTLLSALPYNAVGRTFALDDSGRRIASTSYSSDASVRISVYDRDSLTTPFTITEKRIVLDPLQLSPTPQPWISADGRQLALPLNYRENDGSSSLSVKFWDVQTGLELAVVRLPNASMFSVVISPDGTRVAVCPDASMNKDKRAGDMVQIVDVASLQTVTSIPVARWSGMLFSADSQRLFVFGIASPEQKTKGLSECGIFDCATGNQLVMLPDLALPISHVATSPDGLWLAVVSLQHPRTPTLYPTNGDIRPVEYKGCTSDIRQIAFSQDSQRLIALGGTQLKTWKVASPERNQGTPSIRNRLSNEKRSVASHDGKWIASVRNHHLKPSQLERLSAEELRNVVTVSNEHGELLFQSEELVGPVHWLNFSRDGSRLLACAVAPDGELSTAAQLCVWDTASGMERIKITLPAYLPRGNPNSVARLAPIATISSDGHRLASFFNADVDRASTIKTWDIESGREAWSSEVIPYYLGNILFSPNESRVLSVPETGSNYSQKISLWDAANGQQLWSTPPRRFDAVGFTQSGNRVFAKDISVSLGTTIKIYEAESGREMFNVPASTILSLGSVEEDPNFPWTKIAISNDGNRLAAGDIYRNSSPANSWNLSSSGTLSPAILSQSGPINSIVFSSDERRIVTSSQSGEVKVWDAETNLELLTLPAQMQRVWFDDSGLELIGEEESTVSGEITVRRWNVGHRSAQFEAEQIVRELTTPTIGEPLPLLSEIVERIAADQQLPRETRDAAIALAKGPGRVPVIHEIAWSVVYLPGQSPERYQRALRMIEEICERDPNNGAQWRTRALAHVRLGQPDAALQAMSRMQAIYAAQKLSLAAKDLVTLSLVQLHAGQQDQALANLRLARSKYIRDVFWSALLAEAESLLGADYARQWIGRRVMPRYTLTPVDKSGASIHLSIPYTVTGAQDDLLVIGEGMIPRSDVVLLEDAVTYYSNALEVMTSSDFTLNLRGVAWRAAGEFDKAIADYTAAILLKPNEDYYRNRGQVWLYDKHEIDKALADFDSALELNPNNSWSLVERGNLLAMKGDYNGAFQSLDRAIQVSPDDDYAYGVRAWILATSPNDQHRNGALAILDATKACELTHWQDGDWVENLAAGYAETGDFEKAVEWQEKAVAQKTLAERADFESHLKLYREGKPFRDTTYSPGNITEASSTSN